MQKKKVWRKSPPELISQFTKMMEQFVDAEPRKMFGYPCCFVQNNMCTGLHQEDWILRLPEDERLVFFTKYDTKPFEPMAGRIMKEYVVLPEGVLSNEAELYNWIEKSIAYTKSLPPKVAKKSKKK